MIKIKKVQKISPLTWHIDGLPIYFPIKIRNLYEKIYIKNRKEYTYWTDRVGKKFNKDIDWWMTITSYRNPYISKFLNYFSVLDTIHKTNIKNYNIVTSSKEIAKIIENNFKSRKINIQIKKNNNFSGKVNNYFKSILFQTILYFYINIFVRNKKINKDKKITIVDKFITLNKNQNLNFYKTFKNEKDTQVLIAPTFIPTLNFFRLIKVINDLSRAKNCYIFKEHYLKISDLFFSFSHILRRRKFLNSKFNYKKLDISELVWKEIKNFNDFYSINIGLLNYKFFFRLNEKKVNICKSINWFENQIIDKGWNFGFRKFYFKIENLSFGYQDFNKHYNLISNSPSKMEYDSKVTPEKIIIISKIFKKITTEFFTKQKLIFGETYRFRNLINYKITHSKKKKKIVLILCGLKQIDEALLELAKEACSIDGSVSLFVKPHPILEINKIISLSDIPKNMILFHGPLQKILNESIASITAGPSSALLESICMGVFVIMPDIESGTNKNAKIFDLDKSKYAIINNATELLKIIKYVKNKKKIQKNKKQILINAKSII